MIIRVGSRRRYTVIDNTAVEDPSISFRALGLLTYLLSKPDHWEVSYRHLATVRDEGEHAVRKTLLELEMAGYLVRSKERRNDGTWAWTSTVHEVPRPCGDFRGLEDRGLDRRGLEDRGEGNPDRANPDHKIATQEHRIAGIPAPERARATVGLAAARAALDRGA